MSDPENPNQASSDQSKLDDVRRAIEAILLVSDQPVEPSVLAQLLETPLETIESVCEALSAEYRAQSRGFILHKVAGGWRYQTHMDQAQYVERFVLDGQVARLSAAAMETLAIIAYKQPISRNQVSAIRGVNCDGVARTLESRGYIEDVGRDPGPGRAVMYGTSALFLERLGLASVDDLPPLGQFVPNTDIVEALESTLLVGDESPLDTPAEQDETAGSASAEATAAAATYVHAGSNPFEDTPAPEASKRAASEEE